MSYTKTHWIYGMTYFSEHDQTFEQVVEVYDGMKRWYLEWGYETLEVPRSPVEKRVSFILDVVENSPRA